MTIRYLQKAVEAREGFLPFIGGDDEFAFLREGLALPGHRAHDRNPAAMTSGAAVNKSLLDIPVERALRRLVRRHVAAAARGLERARNPDDHKGLHAFRVAIRRLRSLLRAYRPWLGRAAGNKPRRRLRELTRTTNAARDAHVQLTWLAAEAPSLDREDRAGVAWMRKKLRSRQRGMTVARQSHSSVSISRARPGCSIAA